MTPAYVSQKVVRDRLNIVDLMLTKLYRLPFNTLESFLADEHAAGAAESYLRRALEALMDIGRHILAKGYADGVTEYKEIVIHLHRNQVLNETETKQMLKMAGYRNRMVHFYQEVTPEELYAICTQYLGDINLIQRAYERWLQNNPNRIDRRL